MYHVVVAPGLTCLLTRLNRNKAMVVAENKTFWAATAHLHIFCISPSKSTVPSPLLSASLTTASISFLLAFSPSSLTMACLSSSDVMEPSPSMSNCRQHEADREETASMPCQDRRVLDNSVNEAITHSIHCEVPEAACENGCAGLTSLNASFSSFKPIMPAVSARSLGVISSTKSSKSTRPPTVYRGNGSILSRQYKVNTLKIVA